MSTITHYHKCIRKITASFASLFNNIVLIKDSGQRTIVPLEYADKEKFVKRIQGDPELDKKTQISLPRMSYEMTGFSYDASRKLNTNNKNFASNPDSSHSVFMQYNPVPYDLNFNLTIYTRNIEDGNQIIEQILPYFTPDYSLKVNLIPEMDISKVLPVTLNRVDQTIDSDGLFNTEVRTVIWTLNFTVKGFIFGAIKDAKIIREVNQNIITTVGNFSIDGTSTCCESASGSFIMDANGCGDFAGNEIVYQGQNLELAYGTGKVQEWNSNTNSLILSDVCGKFNSNQLIIGTDSLSIRKVVSFSLANSMIAFTANTIITPNNANVDSCWTTETNITEYEA